MLKRFGRRAIQEALEQDEVQKLTLILRKHGIPTRFHDPIITVFEKLIEIASDPSQRTDLRSTSFWRELAIDFALVFKGREGEEAEFEEDLDDIRLRRRKI